MKEFLKSKEKQGSVCAFFAMLVAMCLVGSYYLQYSQDLYWVKMFTDLLLIVCGIYVFASSAALKEKEEKYAAFGLVVVLFFVLIESIFGVIKRAEWRMTAEAVSLAFKTFGTFTMLDVVLFKTNFIKKWWYVLSSVILLLIPAILKSLPLNVNAFSNGFLAENISTITILFNAIVAVFGLVALVLAVIQIIKKNCTFAASASLCYSLSVVLYGTFGILRQVGVNAVQWSKNTAILFELGTIMIFIAIVNFRKFTPNKVSKKK